MTGEIAGGHGASRERVTKVSELRTLDVRRLAGVHNDVDDTRAATTDGEWVVLVAEFAAVAESGKH